MIRIPDLLTGGQIRGARRSFSHHHHMSIDLAAAP